MNSNNKISNPENENSTPEKEHPNLEKERPKSECFLNPYSTNQGLNTSARLAKKFKIYFLSSVIKGSLCLKHNSLL